MKNLLLLSAAVCCVFMASSCKSKSSAYKAAYEQAKTDDDDNYKWADDESEVLTSEEISYESVKQERVKPVTDADAAGLKKYSVIIGSFKNRTNAFSLKERMVSEGYRAVVAQNDAGWYRVVVSSFDTRSDAAKSRDAVKSKYAPNFHDAWLLERQY